MSLTAFYSVCAPVAICIVQLSPVSSLSIITVALDSRAYLSARTLAPAPPDMPYVSCRSTYRIFSSLSRLLACAHLLFLNPCHSALSCVYLAHTPLYRAYCAHVSSYAYVMRVRVSWMGKLKAQWSRCPRWTRETAPIQDVPTPKMIRLLCLHSSKSGFSEYVPYKTNGFKARLTTPFHRNGSERDPICVQNPRNRLDQDVSS